MAPESHGALRSVEQRQSMWRQSVRPGEVSGVGCIGCMCACLMHGGSDKCLAAMPTRLTPCLPACLRVLRHLVSCSRGRARRALPGKAVPSRSACHLAGRRCRSRRLGGLAAWLLLLPGLPMCPQLRSTRTTTPCCQSTSAGGLAAVCVRVCVRRPCLPPAALAAAATSSLCPPLNPPTWLAAGMPPLRATRGSRSHWPPLAAAPRCQQSSHASWQVCVVCLAGGLAGGRAGGVRNNWQFSGHRFELTLPACLPTCPACTLPACSRCQAPAGGGRGAGGAFPALPRSGQASFWQLSGRYHAPSGSHLPHPRLSSLAAMPRALNFYTNAPNACMHAPWPCCSYAMATTDAADSLPHAQALHPTLPGPDSFRCVGCGRHTLRCCSQLARSRQDAG